MKTAKTLSIQGLKAPPVRPRTPRACGRGRRGPWVFLAALCWLLIYPIQFLSSSTFFATKNRASHALGPSTFPLYFWAGIETLSHTVPQATSPRPCLFLSSRHYSPYRAFPYGVENRDPPRLAPIAGHNPPLPRHFSP